MAYVAWSLNVVHCTVVRLAYVTIVHIKYLGPCSSHLKNDICGVVVVRNCNCAVSNIRRSCRCHKDLNGTLVILVI